MAVETAEGHEVVLKVGKKLDRVQIIRPLDEDVFQRMAFHEFTEDDFDEEDEIFTPEPEMVPRDQAEAEVKEAYDRGFQDGAEVTKAMLEKEILQREAAVERIDDIIATAQEEYESTKVAFEEATVRLALMIAEHIIAGEVKQDRDMVTRQVRKTLAEIQGADIVQVRVSHDDYATIQNAESSLLAENEHIGAVKIVADNMVEPGGCIVETPIGKLDARLKTQHRQIAERLMQTFASADPETPMEGY